MKIVLISALFGVRGGGSGVIAQHLARGLAQSGHQVAVITTGGESRYSVAEEQGLCVYRFRPANLYPLEEKDTHPVWQRVLWQIIDIYNVHCAGVFREILEKEAPDVIHIHKMRGFSGAGWQTAARLFPGRVVQTCHDYESMSPDGLMRGLVGRMALRKAWPVRGYQLIRAGLSRGVSLVTAPSRFTLERIVESGLFGSARPGVIANTHGWSDAELGAIHARLSPPAAGKDTRFLFLGRLEAEKGIRELCAAFARLLGDHPALQLEIAGWGTLEGELRDRYGDRPAFRFLGGVDGDSKEAALSRASVVLVPSLVEEVFGLTVVEAFAFGRPVIASRAGGLPELVREGETGWLVPPGDVTSLEACMRSAVKMNSSSMESMHRTCLQSSTCFSMEEVIRCYLQEYQALPAVCGYPVPGPTQE